MKKSKIMKALLVFGMSMVTATAIVGFTACGDDHEHVDENKDGKCDVCETDMTPSGEHGGGTLTVAVEKVELNKNSLTLDIGGEETLTATVTPDNADNKTVSWSVAPAGVVTVTNGKVKAEAAGTATVTATAGGKTATCTVTVNEPAPPKTEVTEEEWQAALSNEAFINFSATMTETGTEQSLILEGNLAQGKYHYNTRDGEDVYYAKEGAVYYKYTKGATDTNYTLTETTQEAYDNGLLNCDQMTPLSFSDKYESFTHDEENDKYTATGVTVDGKTCDVEAKFENGKLVYVSVDFGNDVNVTITYAYDIGEFGLPTLSGGETPDPEKVPNITEWGAVDNAVYNPAGGTIWHHIFLDDSVAKKYDFDSYEVTALTVGGTASTVITSQSFDENVGDTHTYHMHIQINGDKYQTTVFSIAFKKDGEIKATGTYTREGDKEIALDSYSELLSIGSTVTINITSINGSNDFSGKKITWSIADTEGTGVATIPDNSDGASVEVTAAAAGKATLTCTIGEGEGAFSKTCAITVQTGPVVIEAVDVSSNFVFNNKFTTSKDAIQVRCELNGKSEYAELVKQIDPSQTTVTVTMDGEESTGNIIHKQWQAENTFNLYIQIEVASNWDHDYAFTFSFKNSKGVEVAYGTYNEAGPAVLHLSKEKLNLRLTEDGSPVTEILKATKTAAAEGDIAWKIEDTEGEGVATITANEDGTYTVTAVAKGTATVTVTVGDLEKTCVVTVLGKDDTPPPPESDFVFECNKYYGDWWVEFTIKSAPEGFTNTSYNFVRIFYDGCPEGGQQVAANYFAETNIFQVYCAKAPKVYASEYKFEFVKDGKVVATYNWTNDGTAPTV